MWKLIWQSQSKRKRMFVFMSLCLCSPHQSFCWGSVFKHFLTTALWTHRGLFWRVLPDSIIQPPQSSSPLFLSSLPLCAFQHTVFVLGIFLLYLSWMNFAYFPPCSLLHPPFLLSHPFQFLIGFMTVSSQLLPARPSSWEGQISPDRLRHWQTSAAPRDFTASSCESDYLLACEVKFWRWIRAARQFVNGRTLRWSLHVRVEVWEVLDRFSVGRVAP